MVVTSATWMLAPVAFKDASPLAAPSSTTEPLPAFSVAALPPPARVPVMCRLPASVRAPPDKVVLPLTVMDDADRLPPTVSAPV